MPAAKKQAESSKAKNTATNTIRINNTTVSKIALPEPGQKILYWDEELKGFLVKATSTGVSYMVMRRAGKGRDSKLVKFVLGKREEISADMARDKAAMALAQLRQGINLSQQAKEQQLENALNSLTLKEAFEDFLASRTLKPRALQTYSEVLNRTMPDWLELPLLEITAEMVQKKHKQISTAGKNKRGKGSANQAMRVLRAVFNYAIATKRDATGKPAITENPVKILSALGTWNKLQPRDNYIKDKDLESWYEKINLHTSDKLKDFFLFLLFSGCRRNEAAYLQWTDVDFKNDTFTIQAENNKTSKARELPLSDILLAVLKRRKQARIVGNPYVFVGNHNKGHLIEPKKAVATHVEKSGIKWCAHDLRRTYCTVASRLDTNYLKLKALVGHSVTGDITSKHYVQTTVDDLRQPMQQIADYLKEKMGIKDSLLEVIG